ncbi:unnamed protein product [Triticum turgidum subsp. durum]|uniref:F-box domain-containing protein n=1 Tax=Triticum turgidum subsp. durum TaxID=4567 RepID=A0A9R0SK23_TRITD|nr:unnamed protein product [Triticum turgidum subsp. durum]
MDGARRSTDASDEQEPKRPCLAVAGGRNGGAGGAGGSDAGDDDSHGDAGGGGGDAGGGGGVGHAADDPPPTLSTLGDDVLRAILSRLESSRQTVRMCVLSRSWRHLWRSVPSIHIDRREFGSDHELQSFTDFLLDHHNNLVLLDAFRLLLSSQDLRLPASDWVRRVINQDDTPPHQLKRLHLCNVHLDMDFASHISDDRCPALEDVRLENCSYLTARYEITSFSLKKLVVDGLYMVQDDESDDDEDEIFKLIIRAPALVSLRLAGELDHIVDINEPHTVPSLVDASVHLPVMTDEELNNVEENDATAHQSVLGVLLNVTTLTLSHCRLLFQPEDSVELQLLVFQNLRTLFLDECYIVGEDFVGLKPYLQKSPNLEKLILRCSKVQPGYSLNWYFGDDLVDFMCENLMLTQIIYQHDDDAAPLLVAFLLSISRSLPNNKIELIRVE